MASWPAHVAAALSRLPRVPLVDGPSPVQELRRLRDAIGGGPRILVKRDDALPFGFGGNKVRKLEYVAGAALEAGADTLITCGGVQSNHARVTAACAARLGLHAVLVLNGERPAVPRGNTLLDTLFGADIHYVDSREARAPAMREIAAALERDGRTPFIIPVGASTPRGAIGLARAVEELVDQIPAPDVIVHATSSGGTSAGLLAGCELLGLDTRVVGISADEPAAALAAQARSLVAGMGEIADFDGASVAAARPVHIDDRFVGPGYGMPTAESLEATSLLARTEALVLDPTYTAKAMAGLIRGVRDRRFRADETVLFWHTGGLPGVFR
ncbi:MAG: D-cysteine desulfhydrase family protein [Acidobacteriota bacterium]